MLATAGPCLWRALMAIAPYLGRHDGNVPSEGPRGYMRIGRLVWTLSSRVTARGAGGRRGRIGVGWDRLLSHGADSA